jgi:hypothetical protein
MEMLCSKLISTYILIIPPRVSTRLEFMPSSYLAHLPIFRSNFNVCFPSLCIKIC